MNDNEIKNLYGALIGKGYSTDDLGDEATFASKMSDANNRKQLYDWVVSNNDFKIGDYDTYEKRLTSKGGFFTADYVNSGHSPELDGHEEEIAQQLNEAREKQQQQAQQTAGNNHVIEANAGAEKNNQQPEVAEKQELPLVDKSGTMAGLMGPEKIDKHAPELSIMKSESSDPVMKDMDGNVLFNNPQSVVNSLDRRDFSINPGKKRTFNDVLNKTTAQLANNKYAKEHMTDEQVANLESEIDEKLSKAKDAAWGKELEQGIVYPSDEWGPINRVGADKDVRMYTTAKRAIEDARKMIDAANAEKTGTFVGGFFRGLGDKTFDVRNWDMGVTDAFDSANLFDALKAADDGKELSDAQRTLLDAKAAEMATQAYFSSYIGRGYKAGEVTSAMPMFMLEMAINPASAVGKSAQSMLLRYALRRFGRQAVVASKTAMRVLGSAARFAGDAAGAAAMTGSTGIAQVVGDTFNRMNGEIKFDDSVPGQIKYDTHEGGVDFGTALKRAYLSGMNERGSEFAGGYIKPLTSKVLPSILKTIGLNKVNRFLTDMSTTEIAKTMADFKKQTKYDGPIEEWLEEILGGVADSMIIHDQTLDMKEGTGVFNLDNMIDTFLGVSMVGGSFTAINIVGYRTPKYRARQEMKKSFNKAKSVFNDKPLWDSFAEVFGENGTDADRKQAISELLSDKRYTDEQRKAALDYAHKAMAYQGVLKVGQNKQIENAGSLQTDTETSYDNGYTLESQQEMNDAKNMMEAKRNELGVVLGIDIKYPEQVDKMVDSISDDPVEIVNELRNRYGLDEEQTQTTIDYLNAKATYDGMIDHVRDDIESQGDAAEQQIRSNMYRGGNMVVGATMKVDDRKVYVLSGRVLMTDDGTLVDTAKSDGTIIVKDAQTGKIEMVSPKDILGLDAPVDADELIAKRRAEIEEQLSSEAESKIDGVLPFTPGDNYTIVDNDGQQHTIQVDSDQTDNGQPLPQGSVKVLYDGQPTIMTTEDVQQAADAYNQQRLQEHEQQKKEKEAAIQAAEQEQPAQPAEETAAEEPQQPQTALERIPSHEVTARDGTKRVVRDFESAPAEDTYDAMNEIYARNNESRGGGDVVTQEVIGKQISAIDKKIKAIKNKMGQMSFGDDINADIENMDKLNELQSQIDALEQRKNYWQSVKDVPAERAKAAEKAERDARLEREREEKERKDAEDKARKEAEAAAAEAARIERERVNGVPDVVNDNPEDSRARGFRNVNGHVVERQQPITGVEGRESSVKFSDKDTLKGRIMVVDADSMQPSHVGGVRNASFFIDEAQPKDRSDEVSSLRAREIAANINPEEITGDGSAYQFSAPTVNSRGEVIQGNNRADALRQMWSDAAHAESQQAYKQYLIDHADEFGLDADAIRGMEHPVMVNMVDVDDTQAIRLGQLTAKDNESGGIERINPVNTSRSLGSKIGNFANVLLGSENEDASLSELIAANGGRAIQYLAQQGVITPTQVKSAYDGKGNLTAEAKMDLQNILKQSLFKDGVSDLPTMFDAMPAKAQKAILTTFMRDFDSSEENRILPEIQKAIEVWYNVSRVFGEFAKAGNYNDARTIIEGYKYQRNMFDGNAPVDMYSNFAFELAARLQGLSMKGMQQGFTDFFDLVQGRGNADLFGTKEAGEQLSLVDAIKRVFNVELKNNNNGQERGNDVADNHAQGSKGRRGKQTDGKDGEPSQTGEGPADSGRGAEGDTGERTEAADILATSGEGVREVYEEIGLSEEEAAELLAKMEESAEEMPHLVLTPDTWLEQFGEEGVVETPIGQVKMGANQIAKLFEKGRGEQFGMIKPTLENPNVVIEVPSDNLDGTEERTTSYLFVKTFIGKNGKKIYYFKSVTVKKDNLEVSVSSHYDRPKRIKDALKKGKLLYRFDGGAQTEHRPADVSVTTSPAVQGNESDKLHDDATALDKPTNSSAEQPITEGGSLSSANKVTTSEAKSNSNEEKSADSEEKTIGATSSAEEIQAERDKANTNPTEAQKEAGNYAKAHIKVDGYDVTIENPKGSTRSGHDADGKKWSIKMNYDYGYLNRTEGVDGDHIDVYLSDNPASGNVYVVDQINQKDGSFDEHKVMYGFSSMEDAREAYASQYEKGWKIGTITEVSREDFKKWVESSKRKTKPFAEYVAFKDKTVKQTPAEKSRNPRGRQIQDYGEIIAGARKNALTEIAKAITNINVETLVTQPLGKVWKKPNLSKMVADKAITEEEATFLEAIAQWVAQNKKPATLQKGNWRKSRREAEIREWAETTYQKLNIFKQFVEGTDEVRAAMLEQGQTLNYPNAEAEKAQIEYVKDLNRNRYDDPEKEFADWGKCLTPNPLYVYMQTLKGMDYKAGDKVSYPLFDIGRSTSGDYYKAVGSDGRQSVYLPTTTDVDEMISNIVAMNKVMRGDADAHIPESLLRPRAITYKTTGNGTFYVAYINKYGGYNRKEFNIREEADVFASKVGGVVKENQESVIDQWSIGFTDLDGDQTEAAQVTKGGDGAKSIVGDHFDSKEEAMQALQEDAERYADIILEQYRKRHEGEQSEDAQKERTFKLYYQKGGVAYMLSPKDAGAWKTISPVFKTQSEARAWMKEHRAEVEAQVDKQREKMKEHVFFTDENPRIGKDWRGGRDITPEEFGKTFGFRGVQFGNWANDADRQAALNNGYDSLMDMAELMGISPKAISLNGELGIAFGARGTGRANAHYELKEVVINLTKTRGAGSLAHEWWHALDNYFSRMAGLPFGMVTSPNSNSAISKKNIIRSEVMDAYDKVVRAINESEYGKRQMQSESSYWKDPVEMSARLLDAWVGKSFADNGQHNGYLTHAYEPEYAEDYRRFMYEIQKGWDELAGKESVSYDEYRKQPESLGLYRNPSPEELEELAPVMREFFDTLQEKEGENGNRVLYRYGEGETAEPTALQRELGGLMVDLVCESGIEVSTNVEEMAEALGHAEQLHAKLNRLGQAANAIRSWIAKDKRGKVFTLELPRATQVMVRRAMGKDFDSHNITANGVAHAKRNHGENGTKLNENSIPLRDEDFELIPYIMTAPDRVEKASTDITGRTSVRFYKNLGNGYVVVAEKEYKNSPDDMETITMWAEMSSPAATNARSRRNAPDTLVRNAILSTEDIAKIRKDAENVIARELILQKLAVYHGTGADFDHFDHSHMGEGEGNQAYGWGTYVTEVEGIGRMYAEQAGQPIVAFINAKDELLSTFPKSQRDDYAASFNTLSDTIQANGVSDAASARQQLKELNSQKRELEEEYKEAQKYDPVTAKSIKPDIEDYSRMAKLLKAAIDKGLFNPRPRFLYNVDIPEDNGTNYFGWSEEIPYSVLKQVRDELNKVGYSVEFKNNGDFDRNDFIFEGSQFNTNKGEQLYRAIVRILGGAKQASEFLSNVGYTGIKYPAEYQTGGRADHAKNYVIFNENDAKITNRTQFLRTRNGEVYGFVKDGKMYIDPRLLNPNTPVHEYTHLWDAALQKNNPELWKRGVELMKQTPLWDEVKNDPAYADIKDDNNLVASEVHSRLTGAEGEKLLNKMVNDAAHGDGNLLDKAERVSLIGRLKRWLNEAWQWVKDSMTPWTKEEAEKVSLEDFVHMPIKDLVEGKKIDTNGSQGIQRRFLGEKGAANADRAVEATTRLDNLAVARQMESDNKDANGIKMATGWERGADGKWRYEEPDGKFKSGEFKSGKLSEVWDDDALFKAYPGFKDINVEFNNLGANIGGRYDEQTNTISLNNKDLTLLEKKVADLESDLENAKNHTEPAARSGEYWQDRVDEIQDRLDAARDEYDIKRELFEGKMRSIMVHELQHAIQREEGFARGGSESSVQDYLKNSPYYEGGKDSFGRPIEAGKFGSLLKERTELSSWAELDYESNPYYSEKDKEMLREHKENAKGRIAEINQQLAAMGFDEEDYQKYEKVRSGYYETSGGWDAYRKIAGETEARNVQRRLGMTPEEIRQSLAEETEDVSREDQIFLQDAVTNNDSDLRFRTSAQLDEQYGKRWIEEQTNMADGRHTTQVKNTLSSYKKFADWVTADSNGRDVDILDASSGLGLGTQHMCDMGLNVDDVEPYASSEREAPTYSSYEDIGKQYDYIMSNAVLNVIPDDWRADLLHEMASVLKVGGKLVINVRGAKSIEQQGTEGKSRITLDSPSEILVTRPDGSIRAYQKGFTKEELRDWVREELGDGYHVEIADTQNAGSSYDTAVVVTYIGSNIEDINDKFNENLQRQIDGTLPSGFVYELGMPSGFLESVGIERLPITVQASVLNTKSNDPAHLYDLKEIKDLVKMIHNPIAIFKFGKGNDARNLMIGISQPGEEGKQFLVGLFIRPNVKGKGVLEINSVRNVFPKNYHDWIHWINQDKMMRVDGKEEIQAIINALRINPVDYIDDKDLDSASKIVENFDNPPIPTVNSSRGRKGYGAANDDAISYANDPLSKLLGADYRTPEQRRKFAEAERRRMQDRAEELSKLLGVPVEIRKNGDGLKGKRAKAKGWFDTQTGKVVIILGNHSSVNDIEQTMLHEIVAHLGLRKLFGKQFDKFLENVYRHAEMPIRKKIAALAAKNGWDFHTATEEYLASLAEDTNFENVNSSWWSKIKQLFVDMLHSIGFDYTGPTLSDNELRYILWRSFKNLTEPGGRGILGIAEDVVKQNELKVGNYAEEASGRGTAAESNEDSLRFRTDKDDFVDVVRGFRQEYDDAIKKSKYQIQEAIQDSMLGLKTLMDVMQKHSRLKQIEDWENPYMNENQLSSRNQAEHSEYGRRFYDPMVAAARNSGMESEEAIGDYLMIKHGIERNREMSVRAALTDKDGNMDKAQLKAWNDRKNDVRNDASFASWYDKQREMDRIAEEEFSVDLSERDYSGLTDIMATDDVALALEDAYSEVYKTMLDYDTSEIDRTVKEATRATLDKMRTSGLISKETRDNIAEMYDYYVPLRGFDQTTSEEVYSYLDSEKRAFSAPVKTAHGRSSKADNPLVYIASMADSAIMQGNRNLMKQQFLNFVLRRPSDLVTISDMWIKQDAQTGEWTTAMQDIPDDATPEQVDAIMRQFNEDMQAKVDNGDKTVMRLRDKSNSVPYKVVTNGELNQHQVIVKRGGRPYVITVNGNPRAALALNGRTNPNADYSGDFGNFKKAADYINRQLSAWYTTRNPDFMASNFVRDALYTNSMVWVKESPQYAARYNNNWRKYNPVVMGKLFHKFNHGTLDMNIPVEREFYNFMMNGGETGYSNLKDIDELKKQLGKDFRNTNAHQMKQLLDRLDILNRSVENGARFAAYMASRQEGRSIQRSVWDAKEISVNFNKKGAGATFLNKTGQTTIGNIAAQSSALMRGLYVFFNAGVQGTSNLLKAFYNNPKKASAMASAYFVLGLAAHAIAGAVGGDDDDYLVADDDQKVAGYFDLSPFIRRSNIIIPGPGKTFVSLPLPIEFRTIYGMGELAASVFSGKEKYSAGELGLEMAKMFSQALPVDFLEGIGSGNWWTPLVPSMIAPIAEVMANTDWTGKPIYRSTPYNANSPEWTKAYKRTNSALVAASKFMNELTGGDDVKKGWFDGWWNNPAIVEKIAQGYFGGSVTFFDKMYNTVDMIANDKEFDVRNVPIANRLLKSGSTQTRSAAVNREYFKNKSEVDKLREYVSGYKKKIGEANITTEERDKYAFKLSDILGSEEYRKAETFNGYVKNINKLTDGLRKVGEDPTKSDDILRMKHEANLIMSGGGE